MTTAILHSIKQGAYIAIAFYVVFIAVVTVTSMNSTGDRWVTAQRDAPHVELQPLAVDEPQLSS